MQGVSGERGAGSPVKQVPVFQYFVKRCLFSLVIFREFRFKECKTVILGVESMSLIVMREYRLRPLKTVTCRSTLSHMYLIKICNFYVKSFYVINI